MYRVSHPSCLKVTLTQFDGLLFNYFKISDLTNSSSADQQQGEMAAVESGGGFSQKRNTNSQVGTYAV